MKKQQYVLEFKADTKNVEKSVDNLDKSIDGVKGSTAGATNMLDRFSGGAVTAFRNGVKGARAMAVSMRTLRAAVISTGIGAVVVAVVALVQAVSRLQRVQDQYTQVTAALNVVFDALLDRVAFLGEILINIFKDPQKGLEELGQMILDNLLNRLEGVLLLVPRLSEAIIKLFKGDFAEAGQIAFDAVAQVTQGVENATEKIKEQAEEMARLASIAAMLEKRTQALKDTQIEQIETQAIRNKQIAQARLLAKDEALSFEERTTALQKAIKLEKENLAEKLANEKVEAEILADQNRLTESSREDREAEAQARAKVTELETQSILQQKRLFTELLTIQKQKEAADKAATAKEEKNKADQLKKEEEFSDAKLKVEDEIFKAISEAQLSQQEKEILANEEKYNKLLDLAVKFGLDTAQLEDERNRTTDEINARYAKQRADQNDKENKEQIARDKELNNLRIEGAIGVGNAIGELAEALAGNDEARAKKAFKINKAVSIAQAIISTAQAITAQLAVPQDALTGQNFIKAGIAGATGLAQVLKIKGTQFQGGAASASSVPSGTAAGGGGGVPSTPTVDFSFLQQGANQTSIQAYVLESNVTNSQQANQLIEDQSTL